MLGEVRMIGGRGWAWRHPSEWAVLSGLSQRGAEPYPARTTTLSAQKETNKSQNIWYKYNKNQHSSKHAKLRRRLEHEMNNANGKEPGTKRGKREMQPPRSLTHRRDRQDARQGDPPFARCPLSAFFNASSRA